MKKSDVIWKANFPNKVKYDKYPVIEVDSTTKFCVKLFVFFWTTSPEAAKYSYSIIIVE